MSITLLKMVKKHLAILLNFSIHLHQTWSRLLYTIVYRRLYCMYIYIQVNLVMLNHWSYVGSSRSVSSEKKPLVLCFGEMLIDFVPSVAGVSLAEAPAFKKAPGGAPANVAVGIARLGGASAFIGKVRSQSDTRLLYTDMHTDLFRYVL